MTLLYGMSPYEISRALKYYLRCADEFNTSNSNFFKTYKKKLIIKCKLLQVEDIGNAEDRLRYYE